MRWRAWFYLDGKFHAVEGLPFHELPHDGFVGVEQFHDRLYRDLWFGQDYVTFDGVEFANAMEVGDLDSSRWRAGTTVPDDVWTRFLADRLQGA